LWKEVNTNHWKTQLSRARLRRHRYFRQKRNRVEFYRSFHTSGSSEISHIVKDLNGDGHFELVVDDRLNYKGLKYPGLCQVLWPRVYGWTGEGYTEIGSHYPKYYERVLAATKKKIAAIEAVDAAKSAAQLSPAVPTSVQHPAVVAVQQSATFNGGTLGNPSPEEARNHLPVERPPRKPPRHPIQ
jgi:hypothetical protein